jgi:hypothetical protein
VKGNHLSLVAAFSNIADKQEAKDKQKKVDLSPYQISKV